MALMPPLLAVQYTVRVALGFHRRQRQHPLHYEWIASFAVVADFPFFGIVVAQLLAGWRFAVTHFNNVPLGD